MWILTSPRLGRGKALTVVCAYAQDGSSKYPEFLGSLGRFMERPLSDSLKLRFESRKTAGFRA